MDLKDDNKLDADDLRRMPGRALEFDVDADDDDDEGLLLPEKSNSVSEGARL